MKLKLLSAALLAAVAAQSAHAGDTAVLDPGLRFAWRFGAQEQSRPTLSLGLYPNDLGWRRLWAETGVEEVSRLDKPAVLELRSGDSSGLHLMGLPLNAQALGLNTGDGESSGSFLKPVLIVLGAGVATALVIGASGDAAEDNNPAVDQPSGGSTTVCGVNTVPETCVEYNDGG